MEENKRYIKEKGVRYLLKNATAKLLDEKPDNAIQFLADYFQKAAAAPALEDMDGDGDIDEADAIFAAEMGRLMAAAVSSEPRVTALLQSVADTFSAKMEGLKYKFKGKSSLQRKINSDLNSIVLDNLERGVDAEPDVAAVVWGTSDALRYTMIVEADKYSEAVLQAMSEMKTAGFTEVRLKNYWSSTSVYNGINDIFGVPCDGTKDGVLNFELQFHTPESFAKKMSSHGIYEDYRTCVDPIKKQKLWDDMIEAGKVNQPPGVAEIPKPKSRSMPGETKLFAELVAARALDIKAAAEEKIKAIGGSSVLSVTSTVNSPSRIEFAMANLVDGTDLQDDTTELIEAVQQLYESLVVDVVLADSDYATTAATLIASARAESTITVQGATNNWAKRQAGYTLKLSMAGKDDNVEFTKDSVVPFSVVFHTAKSFEVKEPSEAEMDTVRTATSGKARANAQANLRALYESVSVPEGAKSLSTDA